MPQEIFLCMFSIRSNKEPFLRASGTCSWSSLQQNLGKGDLVRFLSAVLQADQADLTICCQWKGQSRSQLCSPFPSPVGCWCSLSLSWCISQSQQKKCSNVFGALFLRWIGKGNPLSESAFLVSRGGSIRCLTITQSSSHLLDTLCLNILICGKWTL